MDWQMWAPFQSKKMREICEHMTTEEKREITRRAAMWGTTMGWLFAVPFGLVFAVGVWPKLAPRLGLSYGSWFQIPLWLAISLIVILVVIWLPRGLHFREKQKRLLASAEWARSQGYTVDDL